MGSDDARNNNQHLVPDLVRAISSPLPQEQARTKSGPGSRGGTGKRVRDAASAVARRALNVCESFLK